MVMTSVGPRSPVLVVSFYGFVGTKGVDTKAQNSQLMSAVIEEMRLWPGLPQFALGDLNASVKDVRSAQWAIDSGFWHDVGHVAHTWPGG
eukprot:8440014-Alexandrium_andersonii.AAC.1